MKKSLNNKYILLNQETRIYNSPIPVIAITGGIGTGKSTISAFCKDSGFNVIDADALVKIIYSQKETIEFILKVAPQIISGNTINFTKLRELFFKDSTIQNQIENFIYERLPKVFSSQIRESDSVIIYDIPLLFEKDLQNSVDLTILAYTTVETQIKRASSRDKVSTELIQRIIDKQIPIDKKRELTPYVINNSHSKKESQNQLSIILNKLFS